MRSAYLKARDRASFEFALVGAAVAVGLADGKFTSATASLCGVGRLPAKLELGLLVNQPVADAAIETAVGACVEQLGGTGPAAFKLELGKHLVAKAIASCAP